MSDVRALHPVATSVPQDAANATDDALPGCGCCGSAIIDAPVSLMRGLLLPEFWRRPAKARDYAMAAAQILVVWGFAVAQPLYDLLGRDGTFFVAHALGSVELLLFAASLSLLLPALLALLLGLVRALNAKAGWWLHLTVLGILLTLALAAPINRWFHDIPAYASVAAAALIGVLGVAGFVAATMVRRVLAVLSPSVFLFPALFLFYSPVAKLVLPGASTGTGVRSIARPTPVVVVVFDELSLLSLLDQRGDIDAIRFPGLARLAATSWWFPYATATSDMTHRALPAIATGRYPQLDDGAIPATSFYPANLFTWLGGAVDMNVHEVMTHLCPNALCKQPKHDRRDKWAAVGRDVSILYAHMVTPGSLAPGLLPSIDATWSGFGDASDAESENMDALHAHMRAQQRGDRGQIFLDAVDDIPRGPALTFIHTLLPHIPWEHLASGRRYTYAGRDLPQGVVREVWDPAPGFAITGYHRYLLQTAHVDGLVDSMINRLIARGVFDDALIIVTADHGVSFRPGEPRRTHTEANLAEIMRVPMFVKLPGQKTARVSERRVSGVDIVPTIADVIGAELTWQVDGVSMLAPRFPARSQPQTEFGNLDSDALYKKQLPGWLREGLLAGVTTGEIVNKGAHFEALAGRPISAFTVDDRSQLVLRSNSHALREGVAPDASYLPLHVSGDVLGVEQSSTRLTLCIAINGVIKLTVDTFPWQGKRHFFTVMLPESAFTEAHNRVAIYAVRFGGGKVSLQSLRWYGARSFHLATDASGQESLVSSSGRAAAVEANTKDVVYALDRVYVKDGTVGFVGWVGNVATGRAPDTIIITLAGDGIASGEPTITRDGVAARFGESLLVSGYSFEVPRQRFDAALRSDPALSSLRFFARFANGHTVELPIPAHRKTALAMQLGQ